MTEITLKKGSGKPADTALVEAEFALDVSTGKIYSKLSDGKVRALNDAEFIGIDANADNYQYWQYKINGFNTTSVMSTSVLDFQSGDGIQIDKEGYGIKISATGASAGNPDWSDIENKPTEFPPSSHAHMVADITDFDPTDYQPVGDYISEAPEDGKQYARKDAGWSEVQAADDPLWEQNGSDIYYNDGKVSVGHGTLDLNSDGSSTYTNSRLLLNSSGAVRGAGVFSHNTANATEWFYGNPYDATDSFVINRVTGGTHQESAASPYHALMTIDNAGKVGIGGEPGIRAAADYIDQAKAKIKSWTAAIKTKLDEEPKANKKAVTLEVTDGAFEVIPTEDLVAEWIAERAIGGGNAKFQVAGAGYFSGNFTAFGLFSSGGVFDAQTTTGYMQINGVNQFQWDTAQLYPSTDGGQSLGASGYRWNNAYFSGTIYGNVDDVPSHVKAITPTQIANWDAGTGGGGGGATTDGRISDTQIVNWDQAFGWGNHATAGYQAAGNYADANHNHTGVYQPVGDYLTPTSLNDYATEAWVTASYQPKGNYALVGESYTKAESDTKYQPAGSYAASNHDHSGVYQPAGNYETAGTAYTKAESDGKYELKGAGGLPAGDWACNGSITATGNITAYYSSDERLKDDITAMPVGLIDSIEPVTWKWKENGKDSGGVVAQQLQSCGLDDWVNEAPNGDLGVDYNALIGMLIAEVKSLKQEIAAMK